MTNHSNNHFDAIVIGSGLGGLSCALHLAKRGFKIAILEKQPKVGGYAQNFLRDSYYFDVSLHVLSAMNKEGGLHKILTQLQVIDKLKFVEHSPMFTSVFPDKIYRLQSKGQAAPYLKAAFPEQSLGIDKYLNIMKALVRDNTKLFLTGQFDMDNFFPAHYFKKTYHDLLSECFTDHKICALLDQLWQSKGLPAKMCAANWAAEVFGSHIFTGNYYIQGGGQSLSNAMAQTLCEAGATVRTSCLVKKIIIKNKETKGVELESGEVLFSDLIVSNANPLQTYFDLIGKENLTRAFQFKLGTFQPSCSLLTLYLGLDCPGKTAGVEDHTTFVNHDYDTLKAYNNAIAGKHQLTDYLISDYTDEKSKTHPKDCGIVQVLEVVDGKAWTQINRQEYLEKKDKITTIILDKVAKRYPQLKKHIKVCEVGTPRTMQLATRNPYGSVYGFAQTKGQADNWRFSSAAIFQGLYFAGAWSRGGGGGYMGAIVNGRSTSNLILAHKDWNKKEIIFDTAPVNLDPINTTLEKTEKFLPQISYFKIKSSDLLQSGCLLPEKIIASLQKDAAAYILKYKYLLEKQWPDFEQKNDLIPFFFQIRFVQIPRIVLNIADTVRVETTFKPGEEKGKGEFTQTLFKNDSKVKISNTSGRILIE